MKQLAKPAMNAHVMFRNKCIGTTPNSATQKSTN